MPSIAVVAKYIHHVPTLVSIALVIVTVLALWAVIEGLLCSARLGAVASSWWLTGLLLVVLALYSVLGYPHEHARQALNSGSTSDQVMQRTWNALVHGRDMYAVHLTGNVPVSPGPLWVMLNGPFTLARAYAWMNPAWLVITAIALRIWYRRGAAVNLALALLVVSPSFARLLAEGHGIPALACAAVLLVALADRLTRPPDAAGGGGGAMHRVGLGATVALGGCVAVLGTARIIFLFVPVLLGVLVARRDRRAALGIAVIGVVAASVANAWAAASVGHYGPLHLFQRAGNRQPVTILAVGVLVAAGIGVLTVMRSSASVSNWYAWFALCWSVPLLFIGFGEPAAAPSNLVGWEGANYLIAGSIPVMAPLLGRLRSPAEVLPAGSVDGLRRSGGRRRQGSPTH